MNIFTQFFKTKKDTAEQKRELLHDLMKRESELARGIFGQVPKGGSREFFCLNSRTWIWYEEWINEQGVHKSVTTRYVIRPNEIVKSQNGGAYHRLTILEAKNFHNAMKAYQQRVEQGLYSQLRTA